MSEDLIRRQDAIEHLKKRLHETAVNNVGIMCMAEHVFAEIADNRLGVWMEELPSAQPEIIYCKDCKYATRWRSEESARKFGQVYECRRGVFTVPKPEDFCSYAERRTDE